MKNYMISEPYNHVSGDPIWYVEEVSSQSGGVGELVHDFIKKYYRTGFMLSVYDQATAETIEVDCPLDEMPQIVERIYLLENGYPLTFISLNSMTRTYTVAMTLCRGTIVAGKYRWENGKIVRYNTNIQ